MVYFLLTVVLALFSSHHSVWATRFLPTIIWDHLNPLLSCKCNWLVIPDVDLYDEQQFTCPTKKIFSNLMDGYLRPDIERNENIFRRKWTGTRNDLINSIRNGSIHSFCDPNGQGTTRLHTCKNGIYDSTEVTYKYNSDPGKTYEADNIYIFFNNGDDGSDATLSSKEAKCTMLFAVNVTDNKRAVYGMNFDKAALTGTKNCKLSSCPQSSITPSASPATPPIITSTKTPTTASTTSTTLRTPILSGPQDTEVAPTSTEIIGSTKTAEPQKPNSPVPCTENWLNVTIFIVAIIGAFLSGVFSMVFVFALKIALKKRVTRKSESLTLENIHRFSENKDSSPYDSPRQTEVCHEDGQETKERNNFINKL